MTEKSLSLERSNLVRSESVRRHGIGLRWKITGTFVGVIALLGLLVVGIVNQLMSQALRSQIDQRALVIATNLSDVAAGHVVGRNLLALHALLTKYALLEGVAYTFIEDAKGEVVGHSLGTFPPELREPLSADGRRQAYRREVKFRGKVVYETRVPMLGGQVGVVHVGIWGNVVEEEVRRALVPLVGLISMVLLAGVLLSVLLARGITGPILRLSHIAERISKGDLETVVGIESGDEIGELASSLERMRTSLKAAMARLSRG